MSTAQTQPMRPAPGGAPLPPAGQPAGNAFAPQAPNVATGWLRRGQDIRAIQAQEQQKQQQKAELRAQGIGGKGPLRLRLAKGEVRDIVILDANIDSGMCFREHNLKNEKGFWGNYEPCILDTHNCPICAKYGQEGYMVVVLTCLELTGYDQKDQHGNVTGHVPHSRMLLPIKLTQLEKWRQLEQAALTTTGTMRGMYVRMTRGTDEKSLSIGEPTVLSDGRMFWQYSEQELQQYFGHAATVGRDGHTILKQANADITVFPYEQIFHEPDINDLNRRFGTVGVGNQAAAAAEFNQAGATTPRPGGTRQAPGGQPMPPGAGVPAAAPQPGLQPPAPAPQYPPAQAMPPAAAPLPPAGAPAPQNAPAQPPPVRARPMPGGAPAQAAPPLPPPPAPGAPPAGGQQTEALPFG